MRKLPLAALLLASTMVMAEEPFDTIRQQIEKIDKSIKVTDIQPSPIADMYEVQLATGEVIFSDNKGEYFLLGKLYQYSDEKGFVNLTEERMNGQRIELLATVPAAEKVVFKAEGAEKSSVYVFTDVDCPYCRKIHEEVPKLQKMGVTVNYLAFPRGGEGSEAHRKMTNIWCADDTAAAMTQIKQGKDIADKTCDNPVMKQYELGQKMGINGTPAIITREGELIPGYMQAERLAAILGINPSAK